MKSIHIDENLLENQRLIQAIPVNCTQVMIITDDIVLPLYATALKEYFAINNVNVDIISFPSGESSKSREMVAYLQDELLKRGCGRDTCIIALGGGVVTDLAGFVAATYCRGIPAIYLPTTLLAMVDAAIGGKTGVNTPYGKNLIGVFSKPEAIFSDINTLSTLPDLEYTAAFSEIIKHALILDRVHFEYLINHVEHLKNRDKVVLKNVIQKSCEIKCSIVINDEKDHGIRAICNVGHTIGHALELVCNYSLSHGVAVAIGIIVESFISHHMGLLNAEDFQIIQAVIVKFGIPLSFNGDFSPEDFKSALILDKKTRDKIPQFALLKKIGETHRHHESYTTPVDEHTLDKAINFMFCEYRRI
jgi:3-dehydroquinate synthase